MMGTQRRRATVGSILGGAGTLVVLAGMAAGSEMTAATGLGLCVGAALAFLGVMKQSFGQTPVASLGRCRWSRRFRCR